MDIKEFIKSFEGCKLKAYQDVGGILTIGVGHTGKDVIPGLIITQQQADTLLEKDLKVFELGVQGLLTVSLSNNQLNALIDFAYNLGLHTLAGSTLLKKVNNSDFDGAAEEFLKWNHVNGKVIPGLTKRRQAEKDLFLSK